MGHKTQLTPLPTSCQQTSNHFSKTTAPNQSYGFYHCHRHQYLAHKSRLHCPVPGCGWFGKRKHDVMSANETQSKFAGRLAGSFLGENHRTDSFFLFLFMITNGYEA